MKSASQLNHSIGIQSSLRVLLAAVLCLGAGMRVAADGPTPEEPAARERSLHERVVAIKKSLQDSQIALRQYEWIETTVTSLKGEEKARKESRCYYGAEGKVEKVPVGGAGEPEKPGRGLRGKIKAKKKEELADYMEQASELVHKYVPPDPALIQGSKDAGKASLTLLEPEKRVRVEFRDYLKTGDSLSFEVDLKANRILAVSVATYLDSPEDAVLLDVRFSTFLDNVTSYASQTTLEAKAKQVKVVVQNAGYKKLPG